MSSRCQQAAATLDRHADDVADAWASLHEATPPGWHVGRPSFHDERNHWEQYAFDPSEKPRVGKRSREWMAVHPTESGVVREMARCLREIGEGRWPR